MDIVSFLSFFFLVIFFNNTYIQFDIQLPQDTYIYILNYSCVLLIKLDIYEYKNNRSISV